MPVNKAIVLGNLGQDPEVRYTQGGQAVASFSVATSETFNDKNGERQERTEWHKIVAWGKTAELCGEYLRKGRQVYVEGRLQTRQWEDKEGQKRYTTEIVAQNVQFLGGRNDNRETGDMPAQERAPQQQRAPQMQQSRPQQAAPKKDNFDFGPPPMSDDDIPF